MKTRNILLLAGAALAAVVAGNALAQQKTEPATRAEQAGSQAPRQQKSEAQRRAEAEAAQKRRAERRANRTGDEREKEEEEPLR